MTKAKYFTKALLVLACENAKQHHGNYIDEELLDNLPNYKFPVVARYPNHDNRHLPMRLQVFLADKPHPSVEECHSLFVDVSESLFESLPSCAA